MASPKNTQTPTNTQTALITTLSFTRTPYTPNNLRFYGLFSLPHTFFTPPSYIDHDLSTFHPFAKFKKLKRGALDEVTLDDGNTIHLYLPPTKKFRQPIFVGEDFPVVSDVEPSLTRKIQLPVPMIRSLPAFTGHERVLTVYLQTRKTM